MLPHRRSIRLHAYDYAQAGAYFVTICTRNRECLFGNVVDGIMQLSAFGQIVAEEWMNTPHIRAEIELDEWVIMPNHFHAIVAIVNDDNSAGDEAKMCGRPAGRPNAEIYDQSVSPKGPKPRSIGALMAGFKSAVTKRTNQLRQTPGAPLWQRNYWERVVRNEAELHAIREYICNNPAQWELDKLYQE